jgi:hypothetical protein
MILRNVKVKGLIVGILGLALQMPEQAIASHVLSGVNMKNCELVLVHAETDQIAMVELPSLPGWVPSACQHTAITADERTVYVTTDALPPYSPSVVTVRIKDVDWENKKIDAKILQTLKLDKSGTPSVMPAATQVNAMQPIMPWTRPAYLQTHAPTFLPHSKFFYVTHYTDNRVRGFKIRPNGTLDQKAVYSDGDLTRQTHGVNFNDAGTIGLGVGYDYDMSEVRVYSANRRTGNIKVKSTIRLGDDTSYAAMAHYAVWLDNRYAYVGTMQVGPTSLTPSGTQIIGPSIWLIDAELGKATRVIGTDSRNEPGMIRSPSDVAIAHGKLYVAEEDSWGKLPDTPANDYGRDGYISIWDISTPDQPTFIKRLSPGAELPGDFRNAHTISAMEDEGAIYVSSFLSNHLVKIDTETDTVSKVYTMDDGIHMFHGEFAAGRNR